MWLKFNLLADLEMASDFPLPALELVTTLTDVGSAVLASVEYLDLSLSKKHDLRVVLKSVLFARVEFRNILYLDFSCIL